MMSALIINHDFHAGRIDCNAGRGILHLRWADEFETIDPASWSFQYGDGSAYGLPSGKICIPGRTEMV